MREETPKELQEQEAAGMDIVGPSTLVTRTTREFLGRQLPELRLVDIETGSRRKEVRHLRQEHLPSVVTTCP